MSRAAEPEDFFGQPEEQNIIPVRRRPQAEVLGLMFGKQADDMLQISQLRAMLAEVLDGWHHERLARMQAQGCTGPVLEAPRALEIRREVGL